jgi:SAM-dependent methyltransferase
METEEYTAMAAVEARHWWFTGRRRVLAALIKSLNLRPGAEILELGSGTGGNFALLSGFGRLTAVEMNETARTIAAAQPGGTGILAGALPYDLPLGTNKYDLICLFDVLEHIEEDEPTLSVIRGLLAPGGAAIITVPAHPSLFGPHDVSLHHKRRYTRTELEAKLHRARLSIAKLTYMNAALAPLAFALRWLDKTLGRTQATGRNIPSRPVNALFTALFGAEAYILPHANLPFGLSLAAIVRAPK